MKSSASTGRFLCDTRFLVPLLFMTIGMATSQAQPKNQITFINQAGSSAQVKLIGPTRQIIDVPNGEKRTVNVAAGEYYTLVRYGSKPQAFRYTKGQPFLVQQTATHYSVISITLHQVVHGNYRSQPVSSEEFDQVVVDTSTVKVPAATGSKAVPHQTKRLQEPQIVNDEPLTFQAIKIPNFDAESSTKLERDLDGGTLRGRLAWRAGETVSKAHVLLVEKTHSHLKFDPIDFSVQLILKAAHPGVRTTAVDPNGRFAFAQLPAGMYYLFFQVAESRYGDDWIYPYIGFRLKGSAPTPDTFEVNEGSTLEVSPIVFPKKVVFEK